LGLTGRFDLDTIITLLIMSLTSMPVHEWAHAWAAYQLGDDTAALRGRLTLNPLAHIDLMGTLSLFLVGYGWGKPVPVSPYRLRGNMRASWALVSFAGPFSNLVLAMLAAIPFRMGWLYGSSDFVVTLQNILFEFILINLGLMLFNLIPFPPLDGSRILGWLLPRAWANAMDQLERYSGPMLMIVLFLLSRLGVFSAIIMPAMVFLVNALLFY
jgi:Zn-dependent protease